MMWKPGTTHTLNVASLGTRWLAFRLLFDHTFQLESSDVSTHSIMEVRYKMPLCLSQDIAQVWSFNTMCAFLQVEHWQFLLYIMEKNHKAYLHIHCDSEL